MTDSASMEQRAAELRHRLVADLHQAGYLHDEAWRAAVEVVPRHVFVPGFYRARRENGLPAWEPVTAASDPDGWLESLYSNTTLVTQLGGMEPDWANPQPVMGPPPTSSSTLPSLVVQMWQDAEISEGMNILEVGTGTGYSTALACERLGSKAITSLDVESAFIARAGEAMARIGYAPALMAADGLWGHRPRAPYDRIVAACSVARIPGPWLEQTAPGGKILTTLTGWLYGQARVLLTVHGGGTAEGAFLPGTISFMSARQHAAPGVGAPEEWLPGDLATRPADFAVSDLLAPTAEGFHAHFLAQLAAPRAQLAHLDDGTCALIDITDGSVAYTRDGAVHQGGPQRLWDRIETLLSAWTAAGSPGPEAMRLRIEGSRQEVSAAGRTFVLPA